jgi:DNA modification methylase
VVFDPFAGHNSRMALCIKAGRHYIGCDLSTEFMAFNRQLAAKLRKNRPGLRIDLHEGDSRKVPVADGLADFCVSSPPYYDIEWYGDEPEQLGKCKTYEDFMEGMGQVFHETYRVLRHGSYCAWFVNDFRRKGRFHSYHIDSVLAAERAGFQHVDLIVVDFGYAFRDCFLQQSMDQKIIPKRHEFCLIFQKPEKKRKS